MPIPLEDMPGYNMPLMKPIIEGLIPSPIDGPVPGQISNANQQQQPTQQPVGAVGAGSTPASNQNAAVDQMVSQAAANMPQAPAVPGTGKPVASAGPSMLEGQILAGAGGDQGMIALAGMLAQGRQDEVNLEQEMYDRKQSQHSQLLEIQKLNMMYMSPMQRDMAFVSGIEDPRMRNHILRSLDYLPSKPVFDPSNIDGSIQSMMAWNGENPNDPADIGAALAYAQEYGVEVEFGKDGEATVTAKSAYADPDKVPVYGMNGPEKSSAELDLGGEPLDPEGRTSVVEGPIRDIGPINPQARSQPGVSAAGRTRRYTPGGAPLTEKKDMQKYIAAEHTSNTITEHLNTILNGIEKYGTEWWNPETAADFSGAYNSLMLVLKDQRQLGTLDKGVQEVVEGMLGNSEDIFDFPPGRKAKKNKQKALRLLNEVQNGRNASANEYLHREDYKQWLNANGRSGAGAVSMSDVDNYRANKYAQWVEKWDADEQTRESAKERARLDAMARNYKPDPLNEAMTKGEGTDTVDPIMPMTDDDVNAPLEGGGDGIMPTDPDAGTSGTGMDEEEDGLGGWLNG